MPFAQSDEGVAILDYALDNRPSTGEWAAGWFSQRARSPLVPVGCLRFRAARTQIFHRNHRSHFSQTRWILLSFWRLGLIAADSHAQRAIEPPGGPARHRAYLIKVRNPLH
jgi:hypothetical protein